MGHDAVTPVHTGPRKETPRPHDRFLEGYWSGHLEAVLHFPKEHPLVIGAGWLELERKENRKPILPTQTLRRNPRARRVGPRYEITYQEFLTAEIVRRRADMPVIPGSSLKGAVRQVHELLVPSCAWFRCSCQARPRDTWSKVEICSTCSLFGANGLMGRVRFQEGVTGQGVYFARRKVPAAWKPQKWKDGKLRVYDQRRDLDRDHQPREEGEWTYATWGPYHCSLTLVNASDDELGLLFAALGVGWTGPGPGLRLGGKKFHGFGAATVTLIRAEQRPASLLDRSVVRLGDDANNWAAALRDQALDREPARRAAWTALHQKMARTEETHHADT